MKKPLDDKYKSAALDDLMSNMDDYEFEKKLKPLLTITVAGPDQDDAMDETDESDLEDPSGHIDQGTDDDEEFMRLRKG